MRLRANVDLWGRTLFTSLGLVQVLACSGATSDMPGSDAAADASGDASWDVAADVSPDAPGDAAREASADGSPDTGPGGDAGPSPCRNPTPIPAGSPDSGFEQCDGPFVHRSAIHECTSSVPRPNPVRDGGTLDGGAQCLQDSDCTAHPYGFCVIEQDIPGGPVVAPTMCFYGCVRDDQCQPGFICECDSPVGVCVSATCTSDSACGPGLLCASYDTTPGCPGKAFACQSAQDTCGGNSDCPPGQLCGYDGTRRSCTSQQCAIGRPFLVRGVARTSRAVGRREWQAATRPAKPSRYADRARLAAEWTRLGLMEHASIAAFARFTLQLLALGAPADLVAASNAAAVDETEHAKMCFAMASAHAGAPVGPGPLAVGGALDALSLRDALIGTIREGCVGETIAALEAAEAREHATDPAVRAMLDRIARDELRHAELAWRFVRWALDQGGDELRVVAAQTFAEEWRRPSTPGRDQPTREDLALLAGGIVPDGLRGAIRAEAMARVVIPCAGQVLGAPTLAA
jgi:hypothetical protein